MNSPSLRIDKWLWYARFFKSRSRATDLCSAGRIRVNNAIIRKAHHPLRPGDVLTFATGRMIRVVRVLELGTRRGPATEARNLYEDLTADIEAPAEAPRAPVAARERGAGRPTKAERRAVDNLRGET